VPYNGMEDLMKESRYNQGYLATVKRITSNMGNGKNECKDDKKLLIAK